MRDDRGIHFVHEPRIYELFIYIHVFLYLSFDTGHDASGMVLTQ